jgi:nicotinamide-nucleotide amidase
METVVKYISAEIINIGDELLAGHTLNTNACSMSSGLRAKGIPVTRHTVVPDEKNAIRHALDHLLDSTTHVFITGGLGPTGDDRTKSVVTEYFGGKLVFRQDVFDEIEAMFRERGRIMSPGNREQALLPDNAGLIPNAKGTAKGMIFQKAGRSYYILPGVPYEMLDMLQQSILPRLAGLPHINTYELQINTFGLPESEIADKIAEHFPDIASRLDLGFYPSVRGITIRLKGPDADLLEQYRSGICTLLGNAVYSLNGETLPALIVRICLERHLTLVTAESCTGGLIADMITNIPGASGMFLQGYIVYSNASKTDVLGVDPAIIERCGAVSRETVEAMAAGAQKRSHSDISVAVSGIAGPDGGTPDKPVGTVWISVSRNGVYHSEKLTFNRGRLKNKEYAAYAALNRVRLLLQDTQIKGIE